MSSEQNLLAALAINSVGGAEETTSAWDYSSLALNGPSYGTLQMVKGSMHGLALQGVHKICSLGSNIFGGLRVSSAWNPLITDPDKNLYKKYTDLEEFPMCKMTFLSAFFYLFSICSAEASQRNIAVFVALADNQHQGIVPVPERLGNGEDPEPNLYWGAADGLKSVFDRSSDWKLVSSSSATEDSVLRRRVYRHSTRKAVLYAMAYKGAAIKECLMDFEKAVRSGAYDMVVFIGHNGLMDFSLPPPEKLDRVDRVPDCIVLCCKSERYFRSRIEGLGGKPVLLTTQLMYPGAFILHAALDSWLSGKGLQRIRESAGNAYARNQKLSRRAGIGVFAVIN